MTDSNEKPLTPNYVPDVGRLVTDRYDFQSHVNGTAFRHHADQIDLVPLVTIQGFQSPNVQDAIQRLANIIGPQPVPNATTTSVGVIQLSGDIGGSATNVTVTGLYNHPLSPVSPTPGEVLSWNGASWAPSAIGTFIASNDLVGNSASQTVVSVTGISDVLMIKCSDLFFAGGTTPQILQAATTGAGTNLTISAQSTTGPGFSGGNINISGGQSGSGGVSGSVFISGGQPFGGGFSGGVSLQLSANSVNMLQAIQLANSPTQRVLSLVGSSNLLSTDMPANTGDMVVYVRNAVTPPTTGIPANGAILYSYNGLMSVANGDGTNFPLGSIPNPSTWGASPAVGQTITYRDIATSSPGIPVVARVFALPANTAVRVDAILIGKSTTTADSAQYNVSIGYIRNGSSAPVAVGTLTSADPRFTGLSMSSTPTISLNGNSAQIVTGAASSLALNWTVVTQFILAQ
jgi:hypothetical protein